MIFRDTCQGEKKVLYEVENMICYRAFTKLCSFLHLHYFLSGNLDIPSAPYFLETFNMYFFFRIGDKVSQPFKVTLHIFRHSAIISAQRNLQEHSVLCFTGCRLGLSLTGLVTVLHVCQECTNFLKIQEPLQNSRHKKGGMKQVS